MTFICKNNDDLFITYTHTTVTMVISVLRTKDTVHIRSTSFNGIKQGHEAEAGD